MIHFRHLTKSIIRDRSLIILVSPVLAYFLLFHYVPMYGAIIAFKDFNPGLGILGSPWVGFKHFTGFFESFYFWRLMKNTVLLGTYELIWGFPAPIIFALILNELKGNVFKRFVQTVSYLPHFISTVVIVGLLVNFVALDGIVNAVIQKLGLEPIHFMNDSRYFRTLFIGSGIWQSFGWGSIIYLAALAGIDPLLYEAAKIDGANRWRQMWSITLPGILPTISILLILNLGSIMSISFEKVILMYNPLTYNVADILSTYVYRIGLEHARYSFASAVGLFNSVINFILLILCNNLSRKISKNSLW